MLPHVVFTKMDVFIPILQIKAAEAQKLRSLRRVSHPHRGGVEAEAHFCPQSSCPCCHILAGFTAGWGLGTRPVMEPLGSHGSHMGSGSSRGLVPFLSLCLHSTAEGTCELASGAPPKSCDLVRPRVCGCFLVLRETRLKKVLGSSQPAVGECLWNEWVCCLLETPVNRSVFTRSPSFLLGSFPTAFI